MGQGLVVDFVSIILLGEGAAQDPLDRGRYQDSFLGKCQGGSECLLGHQPPPQEAKQSQALAKNPPGGRGKETQEGRLAALPPAPSSVENAQVGCICLNKKENSIQA
jgi:hypothetical protein